MFLFEYLQECRILLHLGTYPLRAPHDEEVDWALSGQAANQDTIMTFYSILLYSLRS